MQKTVNSLKELFSSKGFKNTREREIILKEFEARKGHFNAEELYFVLRRKRAKVSRATIYRTLKLLEQFRLIERFDVNKNCFYYEPVSHEKNYGHLICEHCGKIIDFLSGSLENLKSDACKGRNFIMDTISIRVFGVCGDCQRSKN
jgi:Fur family transcriptional regulator, ferric uptake regulator